MSIVSSSKRFQTEGSVHRRNAPLCWITAALLLLGGCARNTWGSATGWGDPAVVATSPGLAGSYWSRFSLAPDPLTRLPAIPQYRSGQSEDDPPARFSQISSSESTPSGNGTATGPKFCPPTPPGTERAVSWKKILPNIGCDQKTIWTFPWRVVHGQHLLATTAVVGVTTGLILLDNSTGPAFRRATVFNGFNDVFTGNYTSLAIALVPASLYGISLVRKDSYGQSTSLLVGEAIADSEIVTIVMKGVTRRLRPIDIPPDGNFSDTWFKSTGPWWRGNGSFPSGHAIAAFSVATILARRYSNHRWVPYVAYGTAALIGFSRMTLSAHFPSDVFLGGALGYSISRFVVLRN